MVLPGIAIARERNPDARFLIFGEESLLKAELAKHAGLEAVCEIVHTDVAVAMDDLEVVTGWVDMQMLRKPSAEERSGWPLCAERLLFASDSMCTRAPDPSLATVSIWC